LVGALSFDEKIRQSAAQIWVGLRDVSVLLLYYSHKPKSKENLLTFQHFWRPVWPKNPVCVHTTRVPNKKEDKGIFV
jgi:hypothetical protein